MILVCGVNLGLFVFGFYVLHCWQLLMTCVCMVGLIAVVVYCLFVVVGYRYCVGALV